MKLVTFGIDDQRNLIIQFLVFVHLHTQQHLILYQMETVPVPIIDENEQAQSYTYLQVRKPYIALNSETYISLRMQELETCKKIGYEFCCEELFVVRYKTKHSWESVIYFDLGADVIKENCEFQYYFNKTDVKPSVLDGRHEIILANWPNTKYVICNPNHNFPIKIPSHPYVLLKRTVLCNCGIEMENNFLLESIAACPGKQSALTMHYTVNTAFMHYFDSLTENLEIHVSQNWTTHEKVFPISLQTSEFDFKILKAPKTLKDLVHQYKQKGQILNKINKSDIKHSIFDNIIMDIFLLIATILSMIATAAIIHLICKHTKQKALLMGTAFQPVKQTEAIFGIGKEQQNCTVQWYTVVVLTLMIIGLVIYIFATTQKCTIFRRRLYSNTVTVMLFFSDVKQYVPVKLCKTVGSIHLFQNYGQLTLDQVTLERKYLWYVIIIDWGEVFGTLNKAIIQLPVLVKIPLRDKYRLRYLMRKKYLFNIL